MYLSQLWLNPRSRAGRELLADCHRMHRVIMSAFPHVDDDQARRSLAVLYRVEFDARRGEATVLVQSGIEPAWERVAHAETAAFAQPPRVRDVRSAYASIRGGDTFRFRLVANPSKKVKAQGAKNSKRVELFRDEERIEWLLRKGSQHGFAVPVAAHALDGGAIIAVQARPVARQRGTSPRQDRLTVGLVQYDGVLTVVEPGPFQDALANGIGPGKAFGCGLLSIARMHDL